MIIDCISDLHGFYPKLDGGDLLIIAGDLTARDEKDQYIEFFDWLKVQQYRQIVFIAGNHDNKIQNRVVLFGRNKNVRYLEDSGMEFEGLKIWGSPWTKTFLGMNPHCKAFTRDSEKELAVKFSLIPDDVDFLGIDSYSYMHVLRRIYDKDDGTPVYFERDCGHDNITHWMPLPKPPSHLD